MLGEEELGASFLITLKHRSVTPELVDGASRCLADMLEPMEVLHRPGTESTYGNNNFGPMSTRSRQEDGVPRKNDTFHDRPGSCGPANSFSMSLPEDAHWLSELQCYVRSNCCEFFVAGETDVKPSPSPSKRSSSASSSLATNGGARRARVSVGRIGIRCVFCRDLPPSARAAQSTSFPSQIGGVYGAVVMMQCRHFGHCSRMPADVRSTLERIRGTRNTTPPPGSLPGESGGPAAAPPTSSSSNTPGRQQYWAESARKLGLVDSADGIRLAPDVVEGAGDDRPAAAAPSDPAAFRPIDCTPASVESSTDGQAIIVAASKSKKKHALVTPDTSALSGESLEVPDLSLPSSLHSLMGDTSLVSAEDKDLVPDYLFLAMAQMRPCALSESDKVGCYKDRDVGFVGMCCKHCGGQPGFGKYFPATVRSLAQTTTSQTIIKHVGVKCRLCPPEVRAAVLALQRNCHDKGCNYSRGPSSANDGRPKYGSRKVFFQRVWGRLHGEDIPEIPDFEAQQLPPPPTDSSSSAKPPTASSSKKRARPQAQEVRSDQAIVTPHDSDATAADQDGDDDDVSSLDGAGSVPSSSSSAMEADARPVRAGVGSEDEEDDPSASGGDDDSLLTDDRNRRVTVRAGGARVFGRDDDGPPRRNHHRRAPVLPTTTKNGAKSKGAGGRSADANKKARHLQ